MHILLVNIRRLIIAFDIFFFFSSAWEIMFNQFFILSLFISIITFDFKDTINIWIHTIYAGKWQLRTQNYGWMCRWALAFMRRLTAQCNCVTFFGETLYFHYVENHVHSLSILLMIMPSLIFLKLILPYEIKNLYDELGHTYYDVAVMLIFLYCTLLVITFICILQ